MFTIVLGIVFPFCGLVLAQDFDFASLAQPQTQRERLKIRVPAPITSPPEQWEQPEPASEQPIGALLLKTGHMYLGEAVLDKNIYHVIGAKGKPKIPAYKVEYAGTDCYDIYQYKRSKPETASYDGTLSLAKWCVVNNLYDEAIEEFQNCKSYATYPQDIKLLDKEITVTEEMKRNVQRRANAENAVVEKIIDVSANTSEDSFDLRSWRLAVNPVVLEKFQKDVQPQLLRRCGAADCHGSNSSQEFRLTPLLQKYSTSEATLRNLSATFDQLDFREPAASPLLTYPQRDHGGVKAIYARQTKSQQTPIFQWVQLIPNAMPDFVDKYLAQKREAGQTEYATVQAGYSGSGPTQTPRKPLEYAPIEQVSYEPGLPVSTDFSFFGPNRPVQQRVELTPNSNSFRSQPKRPVAPETANPVPTGEPVSRGVPANADPRQFRMPTQLSSKDPFDPNLFNQKYHER
ncbi:MAG: hypothetical protein FWC43_13745 [Planctomycetaceae bacterium]|nr:hypothetical protein [Planctomycetaceae bacterium]